MSDKLWFVAVVGFKPAKRGDSVKPGVERSGTPGNGFEEGRGAREVGDSFLRELVVMLALSHASRAREFSSFSVPGVPLRFTPGFMLPPAARVFSNAFDQFKVLIPRCS
jgi:hypothetical protein